MRGFPVQGCTTVLLLFSGVFASSMTVAQGQTAAGQGTPRQLQVVRTIVLAEFQESQRDRLSGGLHQQALFRMTADSQGRILVTDPTLSLVQVFDTKERKRWQIRGDRNRPMVHPTFIAVDGNDNIYVSEPFLRAVLVFQPDGRFLRSIGGDRLLLPFGLAVDQANHKLYVADHHRSEIQVYTLEGQLLGVMGKPGNRPGELQNPCDLVLHRGMLFVLDSGNERFQILDLEGNAKGILPFGTDHSPEAFAFDAAGNLYCIDLESRGILVFDAAGNKVAAFDIQVPYGQPSDRDTPLSFVCLWENPDGSVLALRQALTIQVLKLEFGAAVPTSNKSPSAQAKDPSGRDGQSLSREVKGPRDLPGKRGTGNLGTSHEIPRHGELGLSSSAFPK